MPIDPSIPMQVGQGVAPPANMLDTFGKYQGIANAMSTNAAIQAHTAQTRQQTAQSSNDYASKQIGAWLALPDNLRTQATARQLIDHLAQSGAMQPANINVWHDIINKTTSQPELDAIGGHALVTTMSGPEAASRIFGQNTMPSTGGELVPGTMSDPMQRAMKPGTPGFAPSGGNVANTLSPGELIAPHQLPTPGGAPEVVTGTGLAVRGGQPQLIPGNGRIVAPPGLANPNRTPPAASATPGVIATGQTPAQVAAGAATGGTSAKAFLDISDQAVAARAQDAILANMQADAAQFTTGTGADKIKAFQNGVIRVMGPTGARAFGIEPERLAANESFDKLANQIANAQGAGSDARLAVNQAANPNSHTSPAGVDMILRQLRGNTDYLKARATLAAAHDPADIRGFEDTIGKNLDPRVFQYQRLTPEQRASYGKSLTDQKDFIKKYEWAEQNRLVSAP